MLLNAVSISFMQWMNKSPSLVIRNAFSSVAIWRTGWKCGVAIDSDSTDLSLPFLRLFTTDSEGRFSEIKFLSMNSTWTERLSLMRTQAIKWKDWTIWYIIDTCKSFIQYLLISIIIIIYIIFLLVSFTFFGLDAMVRSVVDWLKEKCLTFRNYSEYNRFSSRSTWKHV